MYSRTHITCTPLGTFRNTWKNTGHFGTSTKGISEVLVWNAEACWSTLLFVFVFVFFAEGRGIDGRKEKFKCSRS